MNAALEQFHRFGFNGSSVDDITKLAGVPKGSFYNHYQSKEGLLLEVLARYRTSKRRAVLVDTRLSPRNRLEKYFEQFAEDLRELECRRGCLLANAAVELADHSEAVQAFLAESFTGWVDAIAKVIAEAQQAGEIHNTADPHELAGYLIGAWEGALVRARVMRDASLIAQFQRITFNVVLA